MKPRGAVTVGSHHQPLELQRLPMSLLAKSDGRKTCAWSTHATAVFQARSTHSTHGTLPALASSFSVSWRRQVLLSTWSPCLVPGSGIFGVFFCVRRSSLPRVSALCFEFLTFGGTLWP